MIGSPRRRCSTASRRRQSARQRTASRDHRVLAQGERHVEDIAGEIDQPIANTSFHSAPSHRRTRRPRRTAPASTTARVRPSRRALGGAAWGGRRPPRQPRRPTEAYLGNRDGLEQIHRDELAPPRRRRPRRRRRSPNSRVRSGHIAGAVSIPIDRLARQLRSLPPTSTSSPMPRPVLRVRRRRRTPAAPPRSLGPAPRRRLPRMDRAGLPVTTGASQTGAALMCDGQPDRGRHGRRRQRGDRPSRRR